MGPQGSDLEDRTGILCDEFIGGDQGHALDIGLGDEQAIKRVPVQERQSRNISRLMTFYRQFAQSSLKHRTSVFLDRNSQVEFVETLLDCHFEYADSTEPNFVLWISEHLPRIPG